jgi:hypothetical protein
VFAGAAVAGAIGALFVHTPPKDAFLPPLLGFVPLGIALVWPLLWRASGSTRSAALGYMGTPFGMLLAGPVAALPADTIRFAALGVVVAGAAAIFVHDMRAVLRVAPDDGWIALGRRRVAVDDVTSILWDGLSITTRSAFGSSTTGIQRLVVAGGGTTIAVDTTRYPGARRNGALAAMYQLAETSLLERIAAAVAEGETVTAGPITASPKQLEIIRPTTTTVMAAGLFLLFLGFFPAIAIAGAVQDHRGPKGPLLSLIPIVLAVVFFLLGRWMRHRRPLVIPAGTRATVANGDLVLALAKPVRIPLRFLQNGVLVPPLLDLLRDQAAAASVP